MLQVRLAHVEERLARHRRVLHPLLLRHEGQHRLHERATSPPPSCDWMIDGERLLELARDRREVADELVGLLAHDAAPLEVLEDAVRAGSGRASSASASLALLVASSATASSFGSSACLICCSCSSSSFSSTWPRSRLSTSSLERRALGRLLHEGRALPRRVEVERVDVEADARARRSSPARAGR